MHTKRFTLTLDYHKAVALRDRLVPISPLGYSLETFAFLRDLYGHLDSFVIREELKAERNQRGDHHV